MENYIYILITLYFGILLFKAFFTIKDPFKNKLNKSEIDKSDVTIVQPILSGDATLEQTLTQNLLFNPEVNFLWLIDDKDTVAHNLTSKLQKEHSHIKIDILSFEDCPDKINPKVFKLSKGFKTIKTNYVVILDDDAMLYKETLEDLIINLENHDLTTGLPTYKDNGQFFCKIMTQFVNNNSAMTYLPLLWFMSPLSINGMCYALKKQTIEKLNYFEDILSFLADDLSLALVMKKNKMKIYQSRKHLVLQTNVISFKQYIKLMHRWFLFAKLLLKNHSIKENLLIFMLHGLSPIILWALIILSITNTSFMILFVLLARLLIIKTVQKKIFNKNNLYAFGFSLIAELMQPIHLTHAFIKNTIIWRTHVYKVESNERFFEK